MKAPLRQRGLVGALVLTLVATAWTAWRGDQADPTEDLAPPRSRGDRPPLLQADRRSLDPVAAAAAGAGPTSSARLADRPRGEWPAATEGALAAWGQPADPLPRPAPVAARAALAAAAAAPAPVAPPLAYRYVGRILEDGRRRAMLVSPQRSILVEEQELIEGQWRVEQITDAEIRWLWLPGSLTGRLAFAL